MSNDILRGFDQKCSPISDLFFSPDNVELIQKKLVVEIYKKTGCRIPFQSVDRLLIAMRHVHDVYARHLPYNWKSQVLELDSLLIDMVVPDMVTAVEQVNAYEKTINGPPPLLDPPLNVTRRQSLTLESRLMNDSGQSLLMNDS